MDPNRLGVSLGTNFSGANLTDTIFDGAEIQRCILGGTIISPEALHRVLNCRRP